mgnify:FL=1
MKDKGIKLVRLNHLVMNLKWTQDILSAIHLNGSPQPQTFLLTRNNEEENTEDTLSGGTMTQNTKANEPEKRGYVPPQPPPKTSANSHGGNQAGGKQPGSGAKSG